MSLSLYNSANGGRSDLGLSSSRPASASFRSRTDLHQCNVRLPSRAEMVPDFLRRNPRRESPSIACRVSAVRERTRSSVPREMESTAIRTSWDINMGSFRRECAAAKEAAVAAAASSGLPSSTFISAWSSSSRAACRSAARCGRRTSMTMFESPRRSDSLNGRGLVEQVQRLRVGRSGKRRWRFCISLRQRLAARREFSHSDDRQIYLPRICRRISQRPESKRQPRSRLEERDSSRSIPAASPGIRPCGSRPVRR